MEKDLLIYDPPKRRLRMKCRMKILFLFLFLLVGVEYVRAKDLGEIYEQSTISFNMKEGYFSFSFPYYDEENNDQGN